MAQRFCSVLSIAFVLAAAGLTVAAEGDSTIHRLKVDRETGSCQAVLVPAGLSLAHTTQLLPKPDAAEPIQSLLEQLTAIRKELGGSDATQLVKLNVYVSDEKTAQDVQKIFAEKFASEAPAVCYVETPLPALTAKVAIDAVFTVAKTSQEEVEAVQRLDHASVMPAGGAVYIAGQAEKDEELKEATVKTLQSLQKTVEHMELTLDHVVSVKAFMKPMTKADVVTEAVKEFFGGAKVPLSLVEWESTLPIEIEMIVADPNAASRQGEAVSYHTPPGMTASPVYSRVARISAVPVLYVSGLYGDGDAEKQVRDIFASLQQLTGKAGGNLQNLVKATYYVSADDVSKALNDLRPDYYDPKRPPAASKAMVAGVAKPKCTITIDMVAGIPTE